MTSGSEFIAGSNPTGWHEVMATIEDGHIARPPYESFNFASIPGTVAKLLGVEDLGLRTLPNQLFSNIGNRNYKSVVLILVDAFGWRFVNQYREESWLKPLLNSCSEVCILTSQFPSTTAAHVTTLLSGMPVNKSGVYEWFMYLPEVGRIVVPLPYIYAGDRSGTAIDADPKILVPGPNFAQRLARFHISSTCYYPADYCESPYNAHFLKDASSYPYYDCGVAISALCSKLQSSEGKGYHYLYYPHFDESGHFSGPTSHKSKLAAQKFFTALNDKLLTPLRGLNKGGDVAILVVADHGMLEVDASSCIYLDREVPELLSLLQTGRDGKILAPAGSSRDLFLHVRPECLKNAQNLLQENLGEYARVVITQDFVDRGVFGLGEPSINFLSRLGNLLILPRKGQLIYLEGEEQRFKQRFSGHHGGLTAEEMLIPLLFIEA